MCFFPQKTRLRKWLESLQDGLITDWVTMGLAMIIAALSQWRTISTFHLFLCASLAITIPTEDAGWKDLTAWKRNRLQAIFVMCFRMSRIAILSYLIYRFVRLWNNAPGQCFILSDYTGYPDNIKFPITLMAFRILWDISFGIQTLVYITSKTCHHCIDDMDGRAEDPDTALEMALDMTLNMALNMAPGPYQGSDLKKQVEEILDAIRMPFRIFFFVLRSTSRGAYSMINSAYSIWVVFANRAHIVGDEYMLSFGQVAALVALGASFYKIWISFDSRSCMPS